MNSGHESGAQSATELQRQSSQGHAKQLDFDEAHARQMKRLIKRWSRAANWRGATSTWSSGENQTEIPRLIQVDKPNTPRARATASSGSFAGRPRLRLCPPGRDAARSRADDGYLYRPQRHTRCGERRYRGSKARSQAAPRRDQPAAKIVEVIERETHRFVGSYFESGGRAYVQPDGKIFGQPIPSATPAQRTSKTTTRSSSRWSASPTPSEGETKR